MQRACFAVLCLLLLSGSALAGELSRLMPDKVGALDRVQLVTGADAQAEVDRLHNKSLQAEASAIGRYARPNERAAEVWVSRVVTESEARRQTGLMVHKMYDNPKSPFSNPVRLEHNGLAVYRFMGMGQAHFVWFSGDLVWWVSAQPKDGQAFLDAFCR